MPVKNFPVSVEIQTPEKLGSAAQRQKELSEYFAALTMDKLRKLPFPDSFTPKEGPPKNKAQYVQAFSSLFAFDSKAAFESWLSLFYPIAQEILRDTAIFGCCVLENYQKKAEKPLIKKKEYYYDRYEFEPWINLDFLDVYPCLDRAVIAIPFALQYAIRPWFVLPPEGSLEGCVVDIQNTEVFSNALEIGGSFPLLCEALGAFENDPAMHAFQKKQIAALRTMSGFKPFPATKAETPEALDLAGRFTLCMTNLKPKRPEDGQEGLKDLVQLFFMGTPNSKVHYAMPWEYLESHVLTSHLKKNRARLGYYYEPSPSRRVFLKMLTMIARDGRWFSTDRLARYIQIHENMLFYFTNPEAEDYLYINASSITVDGVSFSYKYGDTEIYARSAFRFDLLVKPLFKAYCYLFAALGLLEITQRDPPEPVTRRNKAAPISIYDSLDAVRITNFGRWCLNLTGKKPEQAQEKYEAIADKELLLVTVRGSSFERSLYLDIIGEKLGEDRWRISPRSFIAGCANVTEIEERIKKFKRLIDPKPAPHWETLFSRARGRAGFFNRSSVPATVYYLGANRELIEELLKDPALASCALRAEGRMLVVPDEHRKKFIDLLAEHGVAHF